MKIGVLVPFTNTTLEKELIRMFPSNASLHFTRMGGYSLEDIPGDDQMFAMGEADISEPLRLITAVSPDVILYGCTSATLSHGLNFDSNLKSTITSASGVETITAAGALVSAIKTLGVRKVAFVSPYVAELNDLASKFLSEACFEVVSRAEPSRPLKAVEQGALGEDKVYELAIKANSAEAEVIVLSCTDIQTLDVINKLEKETGKPVISSNQSMMFALAQMFSIPKNRNWSGSIFNKL